MAGRPSAEREPSATRRRLPSARRRGGKRGGSAVRVPIEGVAEEGEVEVRLQRCQEVERDAARRVALVCKVPNDAARPQMQLVLADGNGSRLRSLAARVLRIQESSLWRADGSNRLTADAGQYASRDGWRGARG
eukprot:2130477-Pleurochrysis_carterae.AAC.2